MNLTLPLFPPIGNSPAARIDGTALEEVLHGAAQMVAVQEVVVEDPLLCIDPVPSPDLYDFHDNHPLSKEKAPSHQVSGLSVQLCPDPLGSPDKKLQSHHTKPVLLMTHPGNSGYVLATRRIVQCTCPSCTARLLHQFR